MKKNMKFYALIWAVLFAAFNAVVFLVRPVIPGYVINYDPRFWIAWVFILVAFIGNLVCARFAFQAENLQKMFYQLPLITVSWSALIATLISGCVLMLIPNCPAWIAAVICLLLFAIHAIAVIKAAWAADTVQRVDERIRTQTAFIKKLTVNMENLLARAKSDAAKTVCKKVYEAVRYSDPISNDALSVIEAKITVKTDELTAAVTADETDKIKKIADELTLLIGERNNKCKVLKGE